MSRSDEEDQELEEEDNPNDEGEGYGGAASVEKFNPGEEEDEEGEDDGDDKSTWSRKKRDAAISATLRSVTAMLRRNSDLAGEHDGEGEGADPAVEDADFADGEEAEALEEGEEKSSAAGAVCMQEFAYRGEGDRGFNEPLLRHAWNLINDTAAEESRIMEYYKEQNAPLIASGSSLEYIFAKLKPPVTNGATFRSHMWLLFMLHKHGKGDVPGIMRERIYKEAEKRWQGMRALALCVLSSLDTEEATRKTTDIGRRASFEEALKRLFWRLQFALLLRAKTGQMEGVDKRFYNGAKHTNASKFDVLQRILWRPHSDKAQLRDSLFGLSMMLHPLAFMASHEGRTPPLRVIRKHLEKAMLACFFGGPVCIGSNPLLADAMWRNNKLGNKFTILAINRPADVHKEVIRVTQDLKKAPAEESLRNKAHELLRLADAVIGWDKATSEHQEKGLDDYDCLEKYYQVLNHLEDDSLGDPLSEILGESAVPRSASYLMKRREEAFREALHKAEEFTGKTSEKKRNIDYLRALVVDGAAKWIQWRVIDNAQTRASSPAVQEIQSKLLKSPLGKIAQFGDICRETIAAFGLLAIAPDKNTLSIGNALRCCIIALARVKWPGELHTRAGPLSVSSWIAADVATLFGAQPTTRFQLNREQQKVAAWACYGRPFDLSMFTQLECEPADFMNGSKDSRVKLHEKLPEPMKKHRLEYLNLCEENKRWAAQSEALKPNAAVASAVVVSASAGAVRPAVVVKKEPRETGQSSYSVAKDQRDYKHLAPPAAAARTLRPTGGATASVQANPHLQLQLELLEEQIRASRDYIERFRGDDVRRQELVKQFYVMQAEAERLKEELAEED
jgi:hypothetical protein